MTRDDDRAPEPTAATSEGGRRKPYTPPKLILHGPVEAVTGTLALGPSDGLLGSQL